MKLKGSCHCGAVSFEVLSHTFYPFMRCYCSICRKTAGGGGYAINIMGDADSLKVKGEKNIGIYHARMSKRKNAKRSSGRRHFCKKCASALWIDDPSWCEIPRGKNEIHVRRYPKKSIESWHKQHKLIKI